jgi:hypothetical protein
MLSDQLRAIIDRGRLTQVALAQVLGVPLNRVKNLVNGRVQKLTQHEAQALVERLHVNPGWLTTGVGNIFKSEGEAAFDGRVWALKAASESVAKLDLPEPMRNQARDILFAVQTGQPGLLKDIFSRLASGNSSKPQELDRERLRAAIEAVEEGLAAIQRKLPPGKMAEIILAAYDLIVEPEQAKGKVVELIRLVA